MMTLSAAEAAEADELMSDAPLPAERRADALTRASRATSYFRRDEPLRRARHADIFEAMKERRR